MLFAAKVDAVASPVESFRLLIPPLNLSTNPLPVSKALLKNPPSDVNLVV